jgi:hypothetical protein
MPTVRRKKAPKKPKRNRERYVLTAEYSMLVEKQQGVNNHFGYGLLKDRACILFPSFR